MTTVDVSPFTWRELPECGLRIEHPRLRQPLTLIVDDPTPGYNPAYFHSGFRNGPLLVPPDLVDRFADLVEGTGLRGKFSVIPCPFGLGRVDQSVEGVNDGDLRHFLDVTRERIAPYLDMTPEALTHWNALDLTSGQLLPLWEHVWSRQQDRTTLTPYLTRGLEIMNAVGLPSEGVTSPWDFGDGVENEYAEAILAAQQAVHGRSFSWYFLQMDATSRHVAPRLTVFRPEAREAVVSIVACDAFDFGYQVWRGGPPEPDLLISPDGQSGRLAAVLAAGGPVAFHTHWQTLFSQGTYSGLQALAEVIRRLGEHFGAGAAWTGCADLAHYAAAAAAVQVQRAAPDGGSVRLSIDAPFAAQYFTASLSATRAVQSVRVEGRPLIAVSRRDALDEGTYLVEGDRVAICWNLAGHQQIALDLA